MLSISNVSKTYSNGVRALDDLSLEIGPGMFGLLGPNGAGKSTLMRTIATLQAPDSGSIFFGDIDVLTDQTSLRMTLGYLPQEFGVYPRVTAAKLLDYFARLKGIASKKDRTSMVDYVLEVTNLSDVRDKHVSSYSGGMKRRFGIAQILLNNPKLIIVDEPTAGLDPAERKRFLNLLREIGSDNVVIFSTHLVDDVKALCQGLAIVNRGTVLVHATPSEAVNEYSGMIWVGAFPADMKGEIEKTFTVLSSNFTDDNTVTFRILSEARPGEQFESVDPDLEDAYFGALVREGQSTSLSAS